VYQLRRNNNSNLSCCTKCLSTALIYVRFTYSVGRQSYRDTKKYMMARSVGTRYRIFNHECTVQYLGQSYFGIKQPKQQRHLFSVNRFSIITHSYYNILYYIVGMFLNGTMNIIPQSVAIALAFLACTVIKDFPFSTYLLQVVVLLCSYAGVVASGR
jgi:hypothetical protein